MLSPPLHATHGHWEVSANIGENQRLFYKEDDKVFGFALSGDLVTSANGIYRDIYSA